MKVKTLGFPVIHNFPGDIREFTPNLFQYLNKYEGLRFYLEKGYGERLGYSEADYKKVNDKVKFVKMEEAYQQDLMAVLKNPDLENLEMLRDGAALFTMIHYETRPAMVELIERKKLTTFSMDAIVDDYGIRMFVDYFGTAYGGCELAFETLKSTRKDFYSKDREPIQVTILGAGGVGQGTIKAFEILGDKEFLGKGIPGVVSCVLTRTVTGDRALLEQILSKTSILVDATKRPDCTQKIVANESLASLPDYAVILDLCADRYDDTVDPPMVKGIEGTVNGTPAHKVIYPDDPLYDQLPGFVDSRNRRVEVSCDAWPSVNPHKSIAYYEIMMKNYFNVLLNKDLEEVDLDSDNIFERGLARSTFGYFKSKDK